jgi:uncharacterized phage protein (TIGR01671 family)
LDNIGEDMIEVEKRIKKYRAWNRETKTMDYDGGFLSNIVDFDLKDNKYLYLNLFINKISEVLDLMEFIGKHDKNGKEIYESDIIKWREPVGNEEQYIKNEHIFGFIIWDKEDCRFMILQLTKGKLVYSLEDMISESEMNFYSVDGAHFNWEDLEVRGNIYENYDLYLELSKKDDSIQKP